MLSGSFHRSRLCCSQAGWSGHLTIPPGGISQSSAPRFTRAPADGGRAGAEAGRGRDRADRGRDAATGTAFLLTRRAASLRAHSAQWALPGGRCDPGETPGAGRVARAARRARRRTGRGRCAGPARRLSDPVGLSDHAGRGVGQHECRDRAEPGGGRIRASHCARRYRTGGCVQLHHDPRKHAARDPLSLSTVNISTRRPRR